MSQRRVDVTIVTDLCYDYNPFKMNVSCVHEATTTGCLMLKCKFRLSWNLVDHICV